MNIHSNIHDPNALFILHNSINLFLQYSQVKDLYRLHIINDLERADPESFKDNGVIYLCAEPTDWCRMAYQLFHELCHCSIRNHVNPKFLWFEESICELSSYFFLEQLTNHWIKSNVSLTDIEGNLYAHHFYEYALSDMKKAIEFPIRNLLTNNNSFLQELEREPYYREINANIAVQLLPMFKKDTNLWKAITYLGCVSRYIDFPSALLEWKYHSPLEFSGSIDEVISLFGIGDAVSG